MNRSVIVRTVLSCALVGGSVSAQEAAPAAPVDQLVKHYEEQQRPKKPIMPLPYVGQVSGVDVPNGTFSMIGPDGKSMTLKCPKRFLDPDKGMFELSELTKRKGWYVAALLNDLETARGLIILGESLDPPSKMFVKRVWPNEQIVEFGNSAGFAERFRPAINLGAFSTPGAAPVTGSWEWFEANLKKPYFVRVFDFLGDVYIWDLKPWDPKAEPDTDWVRAPEEAAKPAAP